MQNDEIVSNNLAMENTIQFKIKYKIPDYILSQLSTLNIRFSK